MWIVIFFLKKTFVGLVLGEVKSEVALEAIKYLFIISFLFFIHGSLMIMRNTLQGLGYSFQAILSGIGELVGRSLGGFMAVSGFGFTAICLSNPLAWLLALIYCCIMVRYYLKKCKS